MQDCSQQKRALRGASLEMFGSAGQHSWDWTRCLIERLCQCVQWSVLRLSPRWPAILTYNRISRLTRRMRTMRMIKPQRLFASLAACFNGSPYCRSFPLFWNFKKIFFSSIAIPQNISCRNPTLKLVDLLVILDLVYELCDRNQLHMEQCMDQPWQRGRG